MLFYKSKSIILWYLEVFAEYKVKAETERAEKLAKENAESEKELKDTYKELEVVSDVAYLGKNIKKLETLSGKDQMLQRE